MIVRVILMLNRTNQPKDQQSPKIAGKNGDGNSDGKGNGDG